MRHNLSAAAGHHLHQQAAVEFKDSIQLKPPEVDATQLLMQL